MKKRFLIFAIVNSIVLSTYSFSEKFTAHCRDYPPELFFDGAKCSGVVPDLITDIFDELGHEIEWIKAPWARSIAEAQTGDVDILIRHSMTKERELFLLPVVYSHEVRQISFFKSPNFNEKVTSYEHLKSARIGVIRGNFYSPNFSELDTDNFTQVTQTVQLIKMLQWDRVDLVVTSQSHGIELFDGKFEQAEFIDSFLNPMHISFPVTSKASYLHGDVSEIMVSYRESGKLEGYFKRYGMDIPAQIIK
jgi:polar amino acid transport system substrate-binding protein